MVNNKNQTRICPCSWCGSEFHALSHQNCSHPPIRGCQEYWESQEKFCLNQIEELKKPFTSELDNLKMEITNLKNYRDNKMANDTKTPPQDIKDHICDYIIRSEKRIARNEPVTTTPNLENLNESRLEWIEYYKSENFYSRPENRPPNTNCPHWRKYALNENNEEPPISPTLIDNNSPSPASNPYSVPVHSTSESLNINSTN